jgi:hypothetical protein
VPQNSITGSPGAGPVGFIVGGYSTIHVLMTHDYVHTLRVLVRPECI